MGDIANLVEEIEVPSSDGFKMMSNNIKNVVAFVLVWGTYFRVGDFGAQHVSDDV